LICESETNASGTGVLPSLTWRPPSLVGNGIVSAAIGPSAPKPVPSKLTQLPGLQTAPDAKLAIFRTCVIVGPFLVIVTTVEVEAPCGVRFPVNAVKFAVSTTDWFLATLPADAMNVPLIDPVLIMMLLGTVSTFRVVDSNTVILEVAALVSATVQVAFCFLWSVLGVQLSCDNWTGAVDDNMFRVKVFEMPAALAVSVAGWSLVTEVTLALNPAVVAPAATVRLAGTVAFVLLLESVTGNPPVGADLLSETTQDEEPGPVTLAGEQLTLLNVAGAGRLTVAVLLCPFQLAVTVAVWSLVTVPPVAVNVPVVNPELIVILAGTLKRCRAARDAYRRGARRCFRKA
jgi:hypothetical protein